MPKVYKRCNDWPACLALFIQEKRHQPFSWKVNSCGFFLCDWLAIMVRVDPAKGLRRRSEKYLKSLAGPALTGLAGSLATKYGWPEQHVNYARRGDPVLIVTPQGPTLGVCAGAFSAFAGVNGIEYLPTLSGLKSWRVG